MKTLKSPTDLSGPLILLNTTCPLAFATDPIGQIVIVTTRLLSLKAGVRPP